jgi:hypothetical protein
MSFSTEDNFEKLAVVYCHLKQETSLNIFLNSITTIKKTHRTSVTNISKGLMFTIHLFNDAVRGAGHTASNNDWCIMKSKIFVRKYSPPNLTYYPRICWKN